MSGGQIAKAAIVGGNCNSGSTLDVSLLLRHSALFPNCCADVQLRMVFRGCGTIDGPLRHRSQAVGSQTRVMEGLAPLSPTTVRVRQGVPTAGVTRHMERRAHSCWGQGRDEV